jgi:hypothetical protein
LKYKVEERITWLEIYSHSILNDTTDLMGSMLQPINLNLI